MLHSSVLPQPWKPVFITLQWVTRNLGVPGQQICEREDPLPLDAPISVCPSSPLIWFGVAKNNSVYLAYKFILNFYSSSSAYTKFKHACKNAHDAMISTHTKKRENVTAHIERNPHILCTDPAAYICIYASSPFVDMCVCVHTHM
jgi:hypothetical protein